MSFVYAQDVAPAPVVAPVRRDTRTLWFESFDGHLQVPVDGRPVKMLRGARGLMKAPEDPIVSTSPGVPGGFLEESRVGVRPLMLPLQVLAPTQGAMYQALANLRRVLQWNRAGTTLDGSCYLMGSSAAGVRRLTVAYASGLEGEDGGMPNLDRLQLNLVAVDPYAYDRDLRPPLRFGIPSEGGAFLSDDPADTWETRSLSSSAVFGLNMPVTITSDVGIHPRIDVTGPFAPDLLIEASTGLTLPIPGGIPAGQTLTVITNPRAKSIRLNGAPAAGRVAFPNRLGAPFVPGTNRMNVVGTGATTASEVVITWRGAWESMWG